MEKPLVIHACDHVYVRDVVGVSGEKERVFYVFCKEMGEYIYVSPLSGIKNFPRGPNGEVVYDRAHETVL